MAKIRASSFPRRDFVGSLIFFSSVNSYIQNASPIRHKSWRKVAGSPFFTRFGWPSFRAAGKLCPLCYHHTAIQTNTTGTFSMDILCTNWSIRRHRTSVTCLTGLYLKQGYRVTLLPLIVFALSTEATH